MSTQPGATRSPRAPISRRPAPTSPPTAAMRAPWIATSPSRSELPVPSAMVALRMTRSCMRSDYQARARPVHPTRTPSSGSGTDDVEGVDRVVELEDLEGREAGRAGHLAGEVARQAEGPETRAPGLREGRRQAREHRHAVHHGGHRIALDLRLVAATRLDVADQPHAIVPHRAANAMHDTGRVGHVVQATEGGDERERAVSRQRIGAGREEG